MRRLGIIDLGSNTMRLIIVDIHNDGSFKLANELKETVRLGGGLIKNKKLKPESIRKTVQAVNLFKELCSVYNTDEIVAVATAAVRNAENGEELINLIKNRSNIEFSIIPGEEEAKLDYYGVINTMAESNAFLLDIGGGSMEIIKIKDRKMTDCTSIPLGVVSMTEGFLNGDPPEASSMEKLEKNIENILSRYEWLKDKGISTLIGIGGTIRTVAKIDRRKRSYPLKLLHNYTMNYDNINEICNDLKGKTLKERKKVPGLSNERADIIIAGILALRVILRYLNINRVIISGSGIREGILYKNVLAENNIDVLDDVVTYSVYNTLKFYNVNELHANVIRRIACSLFDNLKPLHGYGEKERRLLSIAAMLHDIGLVINYYHHSTHSGYLILNNGINGLTHKEIIICAMITMLHEGNGDDKIFEEYKNLISNEDICMVRKMGLILKIAERLDISESGRVKEVSCDIDENEILLKLFSDNNNLELEKYGVEKSSDQFFKLFKRKINVL